MIKKLLSLLFKKPTEDKPKLINATESAITQMNKLLKVRIGENQIQKRLGPLWNNLSKLQQIHVKRMIKLKKGYVLLTKNRKML